MIFQFVSILDEASFNCCSVIYGCGAYQCLVIDSYTKFRDGTAAFNIPAKKIADPLACAGCTDYDAAWCINMCICNILPCIVILWRKEIREKYGIKVTKGAAKR